MEKKDNILNVLTEEQRNFLEENFRKIGEIELFQKISEIGPALDQAAFGNVLHEMASRLKEKVMKSELSDEELSLTSGGDGCYFSDKCDNDSNNNCSRLQHRYLRDKYGTINCAASVEPGSWCLSNDACFEEQVHYRNRGKNCDKAW